MPFVTPTLADLILRAEADMSVRTGVGPLLPRGPMKAFSRAWAGSAYGQHLHLAWAADQVLPSTADTELLDDHGDYRGVPRKAATFSTGDVTFTGADTTSIPVGTEVTRADGRRFVTDTLGTVAGGFATVPVTAVLGGKGGDTDAATVLTLVLPVSGLDADVTVAAGALTGGEDQESDDAFRARIAADYREPILGGKLADYATWALQVPGVTRAWGIDQINGVGTVGLTFAVDDEPAGPVPGAAKVAEVDAYVRARKPVTPELTVLAPTLVPIVFQFTTLSPNDATTQANVTTALQDLILRAGEPGQPFLLSRIREAISNTPGELDHVLASPSADTTIGAAFLPSFGGITF